MNRVDDFFRTRDYACWCGQHRSTPVCHQLFGNHPFAIRKCRACRTHRILPRALTSLDEAESLYNQQDFFHTEAELEQIKEHDLRRLQALGVRLAPGRAVLDVGCGDGRLLNAICDGFGCTGLGIDLDQRRISAARVASKSAQFECGLFEARQLNRKFDVVVSVAVLEHVIDPVGFLAQLRGALEPGGSIFGLTPNAGSLSYRVLGSWWRELLGIGQHIYLFSPESLRACAHEAGLEIVGILTDFDFGPPPLDFTSARGFALSVWWCYREIVRRLAQLFRTPTSGDLLSAHLKAI